MNPFSIEEINLMCIYGGRNRHELIGNLRQMQKHLSSDEEELHELTRTTIRKLEDMTDEQFDALSDTLIPDFDGLEV